MPENWDFRSPDHTPDTPEEAGVYVTVCPACEWQHAAVPTATPQYYCPECGCRTTPVRQYPEAGR
jgi:Zn finger protein HypA/HybF involved in hydrogenase expression